nr:Na+/H+ antiporter NhaA [Candidatus Hamiltonella defensa]
MKNVILQFLSLKSSGGMILIIAVVIAMRMANSPLRDLYQSFLDIPITFIIST